jgi:hypothetical protein
VVFEWCDSDPPGRGVIATTLSIALSDWRNHSANDDPRPADLRGRRTLTFKGTRDGRAGDGNEGLQRLGGGRLGGRRKEEGTTNGAQVGTAGGGEGHHAEGGEDGQKPNSRQVLC